MNLKIIVKRFCEKFLIMEGWWIWKFLIRLGGFQMSNNGGLVYLKISNNGGVVDLKRFPHTRFDSHKSGGDLRT